MGIVRAETIARMGKAVKEGVSASRFIRDMREIGLSYRRTDMLADYRRAKGAKEKEGLLRYVRKDRYPSERVTSGLSPEASREFLYKCKVESVIKIGEKPTERMVNIMSNVPMTPAMIEAEVEERWGEWEKYAPELLTGIQPYSVFGKAVY